MFCPKCATQNVDGASFCRSCGTNISLVSKAMSRQLPAPEIDPDDRLSRRRRRRQPSLEEAIRRIMMGIAFVVVSILVMEYAPAGRVWWFWMLIPAAGSLARGFGELVRLKRMKEPDQNFSPSQLNTVRPAEFSAPKTGELIAAVPSVTEGTTRHLGADAPTRAIDFSDRKPS
jgi:hypothetical protein